MRTRVAAGAVALVALAGVVSACGSSDDEVPTGPGASRPEPTGTVNTTAPATTAPADDG